jgi:hypothetical protein
MNCELEEIKSVLKGWVEQLRLSYPDAKACYRVYEKDPMRVDLLYTWDLTAYMDKNKKIIKAKHPFPHIPEYKIPIYGYFGRPEIKEGGEEYIVL